jgi:predicted dehydrogenase
MRIKIIGAGSIGNHLSHAARRLGWSVDLCDVDGAALRRAREEIYPGRYGAWDDAIQLFDAADAPRGNYDLIVIGTPPDTHLAIALEAIAETPRAIMIEKPVCTPGLGDAQRVFDAARENGISVFTGYDHVVGSAAEKFVAALSSPTLGRIETLDVEFREFWGGIFAAHPWLSGPSDSYLGYWRRGGGASGEHSHATNLWQHFAHALDAGRVTEVQATMAYVEAGGTDYDKLCLLNLRTEGGLVGRVVQDVVTNPPRKWARAQGADGFVEWWCGYKPGEDAVLIGGPEGSVEETTIRKTRPDDFIQELKHIESALQGNPSASPISLERGLDTMLVIAAAHKSVAEKRSVTIDYLKGYRDAALV